MPRIAPAILWFAAAFGLYGLTAATGPMWADSAKLAIYALHGYLPSLNPGDHAGWTLLASIWRASIPWLAAPHAFNLFSSFSAAAAVALAFVLGRARTGRPSDGHALATVLLVAHPLWWTAAVTETYALATALVLAVAVAVTPAASSVRAAVAGVAAGLGLATHAFTAALTVPLLCGLPRRRWLAATVGAAAGAAPFWLALFGTPADPLTGNHSGSAASWEWHVGAFLTPGGALRGALLLAALLAFSLGPVGLGGMAKARRVGVAPLHPRPRLGAAFGAALTVLICGYAQFRLHLMAIFPLLALLLLVPPVLDTRRRAVHLVAQAALYAVVPAVAVFVGHGDLGVRELPDRNNAWYFLSPVKAFDGGPARYARSLLAAAPRGAVVLADFNPGALLRLVQETESLRPDVRIEPTVVDDALATADPAATIGTAIAGILAARRPAVLADTWEPYYRIRELAARGFTLEPCGPGLAATGDGEPAVRDTGGSRPASDDTGRRR